MAKVHTKKEAFRDSSCFMISCTIRSVRECKLFCVNLLDS